ATAAEAGCVVIGGGKSSAQRPGAASSIAAGALHAQRQRAVSARIAGVPAPRNSRNERVRPMRILYVPAAGLLTRPGAAAARSQITSRAVIDKAAARARRPFAGTRAPRKSRKWR